MTAKEFCENAEALIGRSYSDVDCIGVVRLAAKIRCQGTNWLWRSYNNSGKYQYLTLRGAHAPSINELTDGLLVFRIKYNSIPDGYSDKPNCHHVGIIKGKSVIQSQENIGVYKKIYYPTEWNGYGWLKQIEPDDVPDVPEDDFSMAPELTDHEMITAIYNWMLQFVSPD